MKKSTLILLLAFGPILHAQPTLTSANSNPLIGEVFCGHQLSSFSLSAGPSGAGVTWNFASEFGSTTDTLTYVNCSSTPYCDSFTTSNIAAKTSGGWGGGWSYNWYSYYNATSSAFSLVASEEYKFGYYTFGTTPPSRAFGERDLMYYPATYLSAHFDSWNISRPAYDRYMFVVDSTSCDAYGTLILPSGTYTNVLRFRQVTIRKDSSLDWMSSSWEVTSTRNEQYRWYTPDFHNPLMTITYDTTSGMSSFVSDAWYYTRLSVAATQTVKTKLNWQVYPIPATENIHVTFNLGVASSVAFTLTDIAGRVVYKIDRTWVSSTNEISIPVKGLVAGIYMLRATGEGVSAVQKVIIN